MTAWLRDRLAAQIELFMVPLHYTGTTSVPYLRELLAQVPDEVPVGWPGRYVVNETIAAADAREWRAANDGRRPLLWDNTPVNDALMVDHLFTGPLRGRDPDLLGEDPERAWQAALGADRVLMEGCDGAAPDRLAAAALGGDDAALGDLEAWFVAAEAVVGRVACQILAADGDEARRTAPLLHLMWPKVTGARPQVLGGRGALLPAFGQDERSRLFAARESFRPAASVTDRLVDAVFARLS